MGWSCTAKAGDTLRKMYDKCYTNSGCQNVWIDKKGNKYLFEISRREHDDGHITAQVWKFIPNSDIANRSGSLYINTDGTVRTGPKFLKVA